MSLPDGVSGHYRKGKVVFEVDTHKARYKGTVWKKLDSFDKRKFENQLFFLHPKRNMKFIYI